MKKYESPKERITDGEAQRKKMPRTDLAQWDASWRKHDPIELLQQSDIGRVPSLLKLKYQRMLASPFRFFRGAAPVMAYDLSLTKNTGIHCQLCGDAHIENLGAYTGQDGRLVFDINDFDETIRGPFEWDVKRMAASIVLAARDAKARMDSAAAASIFLDQYCQQMRSFSRMPVLVVARYQIHGLGRLEPVSEALSKAQRETPLLSEKRLTKKTSQGRVFRSAPPLLRRVTGAETKSVLASLKQYVQTLQPERQFFFSQLQPVDVGFKVVGTGSVGLRDYCILMQGNGAKDPLFLQVKEETASAWAPYIKATDTRHNGERVVKGQRAMQLQTDPLLGHTRFGGRDYLVRQLNDHKGRVDVTKLTQIGLEEYAALCGILLARGHARSGDSRVIAGYIGNGKRFRKAIATFAEAYADQTTEDLKALQHARKRRK